MTISIPNADALLATLDANDDELAIDRNHLIILIGIHLNEIGQDGESFMVSYDICPFHHCDLQICADDNEMSCAHIRN